MTDTPRETILADIHNRLAKTTPMNHPLLKLSSAFADVEWLLAECDTLRAQLAELQKQIAIRDLSTPLEEDLALKIDEALKYLHMGQGFTLNGIACLLIECQRRMAADWIAVGGERRSRKAAEAQLADARADVVRMAASKIGDRCEHHTFALKVLESLTTRECPICWKACAEQVEAQLAAREGEIARLTTENDELTRRVMMAEQHPRSAASTTETAPCDCTRHRHCPRCHGEGCISDGPNFSQCLECGHEWRPDQPEASDARPTDSATGTAIGSATKCLSCAALTERLNQLVTSLGMVYHCDPTGDGTAPGWRNHRAEKAEARADTAEAQLRAQGWQPMETAPKDGTFIAVLGRLQSDPDDALPMDMPFRGCVSRWSARAIDTPAWVDGGWIWMSPGVCDRFLPAYWMPLPLPAPPITKEPQPHE